MNIENSPLDNIPSDINKEDNTQDILLGIKSPFNYLPVPDQPARYPSILSTNNMSNTGLDNDDQLTPLQAQQKNLGLLNVSMGENYHPLPNFLPLDGTPVKATEEELAYMQKIYDQTSNVYYRSAPERTITMGIKETMVAVYEANKAKGFWDEKRNIGEMLMLVTSELAEALEANRKSRDMNIDGFRADMKNISISDDFVFDTTFEKDEFKLSFEQNIKDTFEDEIADAVIRLFDISAGLGIDLEFHIKAKMKYNSLRPHKHSEKY